MNNSRLLLTWKTPSHELMALDDMNNLGFSLKWMTRDCELKALDPSLGLRVIWTILGREEKAPNVMNN